jgi:hypothetical protein
MLDCFICAAIAVDAAALEYKPTASLYTSTDTMNPYYDVHYRFWNTTTAAALHHVDTGSQVCSLMWSKNVNELVSTHGFSLNQVIEQHTAIVHSSASSCMLLHAVSLYMLSRLQLWQPPVSM